MESVSKEVKKTLNEKAGIIEFDNFAYRKQIQQIVKDIKNTTLFTEVHNVAGKPQYPLHAGSPPKEIIKSSLIFYIWN